MSPKSSCKVVLIRAARSQHVADFTCTDMSETSLVERLPTMLETRVQSLSQEDLLEKEMETHFSILAWKIPWTEGPGRLQSMGSQRVGHD